MLRLAYFPSLAFLSALAAAGVIAAPRPAAASYMLSFYTVPKSVVLLPDETNATRVIIHGAFFQLTDNLGHYGDPKCGVMYFECLPGQEVMCRKQWNDLRAATVNPPGYCLGFGSFSTSSATIRSEGAALGSPDLWDLGMGIAPGAIVDQKCPPALMLACPVAASDDGGTGAEAGAPAQLGSRNGCSIGDGRGASGTLAAVALAALAAARRRGRQRKTATPDCPNPPTPA